MFKRYRFVVALVLCLCVFAYDTMSISSDLGGRSFAWADGEDTGDGATPTFSKSELVLSGQLGLYFYLSNLQTSQTGTMTFTIKDKESKVLKTQTLEFNGQANADGSIEDKENNTWAFRCDTTSIEMADTITAEYQITNGAKITNESSTIKSVKDYLNALNPKSGSTLEALVNAIKDYGHYAQVTLSETNDDYNKNHTEMEKSSEINDSEITTTESYAIKIYTGDYNANGTNTEATENKPKVSFTLDLDSNTVLRIYLPENSSLRSSTSSITVTAGNGNDDTYRAGTTKVITAKNVDDNNDGTNDAFEIAFSNISAHQLGDKFTIPVTINNTLYTIVVSPMSYVYAVLKLTYPTEGTQDYDTKKASFDAMGITDDTELTHFKQAVIAFYNYYAKTIAYRTSTEYSNAQ